jgi:hypothetical protein
MIVLNNSLDRAQEQILVFWAEMLLPAGFPLLDKKLIGIDFKQQDKH